MCQSNTCVDLILIWETSSCLFLDALRDTWSFEIKRSITVSHRESYHFIFQFSFIKITSQSINYIFTKHLLKLCKVCDCCALSFGQFSCLTIWQLRFAWNCFHNTWSQAQVDVQIWLQLIFKLYLKHLHLLNVGLIHSLDCRCKQYKCLFDSQVHWRKSQSMMQSWEIDKFMETLKTDTNQLH